MTRPDQDGCESRASNPSHALMASRLQSKREAHLLREAEVCLRPEIDLPVAVRLLLDECRSYFQGVRPEPHGSRVRLEIWGPNEARLARWLMAREGFETTCRPKPSDLYIQILEVSVRSNKVTQPRRATSHPSP